MIARRPLVLVIQSSNPWASLEAGSKEDCITIRTSQAESGYEIARVKRPDLIAVDVAIAGGTGWALCRLLKRDPLTSAIPVVVLNAADTPEAATHAQYVGASAVFTEAASIGDLLSVVRDTLAESSAA